jgi:hypothetical protein
MSEHVINPLFGYDGNRYVISVDGVDEYLDLGHATSLEFDEAHFNSDGVTVTAWVYFNGEGGSMPIVNIGKSGTNHYYGLQCKLTGSDKPQMHLMGLNSGFAGAGSNNRRTRVCTSAITNTRWYHLAWVFDGGMASTTAADWKIYINGVNQTTSNSGTNAALTLNYSGDSYIGFNGGTGGSVRYWGGSLGGYIGDITIHSKVLSALAISEQYATKSGGIDWLLPTTNYTSTDIDALEAWWMMGTPLGPSTSPIIYDEQNMPSGINGTMTNMVSGDIVTTPLWGL